MARLGNPLDRGAWQATAHVVVKELDMTEQLNNNSNSIPLIVNAKFLNGS